LTAEEADIRVHDFIISKGAYPTPIGFMNFPKSVCISTNEGERIQGFASLNF